MIVILDCEYITIIWIVGREASLPCMGYTCTWKGITRQMMIIRDELETMRMGSQNKGKSRFMCNTRMQWHMPNVKVLSELGSKAAHLCVYLRWWSLASRLSSVVASCLFLSSSVKPHFTSDSVSHLSLPLSVAHRVSHQSAILPCQCAERDRQPWLNLNIRNMHIHCTYV